MGNIVIAVTITYNEAEAANYKKDGYITIPVNLSTGTKGKPLFLCYKNGDYKDAITRIQFSFTEGMAEGLKAAGFTKVDADLNVGDGGSPIYMWYLKRISPYDIPITEFFISTDAADDAEMVQPFWERCSIDLNRKAGGNWIHLWMKRAYQPVICDVTATNNSALDAELFRQGYTRIDETTNRDAGGVDVFIWYRYSADSDALKYDLAIRDLQVSVNQEEEKKYKSQGYHRVPTNLNEGTAGPDVFLWYKKESSKDPIKMFTMILDPAALRLFKIAKATVIDKSLNKGNKGTPEYLCFSRF